MLMDHSGMVVESYQIMTDPDEDYIADPFVMPVPTPEELESFKECMKLARAGEIQAEHPGCIICTEEQGNRLAQAMSECSKDEEPMISKEAYDCLRGVVRAGGLTGVIKEVT